MTSIQLSASSGSEGMDLQYAVFDEKKRKRMLSNRESARRSRMKKQKLLEDLSGEIGRLQLENGQLLANIKAKEEAYVEIEAVNSVLKAQTKELSDRLGFLNSIIEIAQEVNVNGLSVDIPEMPDVMFNFNPWQLPLPMQSMDMMMH